MIEGSDRSSAVSKLLDGSSSEESSVLSDDTGSEKDGYDGDDNSKASVSSKMVVATKDFHDTWRKPVVFFFLAVAVFVTFTTLLVLLSEQNDQLQDLFRQDAADMQYLAENQHYVFHESLKGLSETITLAGLDSKAAESRWPFLTLPNFEHRVKQTRDLAKVELISFVPIVKSADRELWEQYAFENQGWIDESREACGCNFSSFNVTSSLYRREGVDKYVQLPKVEPGPFAPVWQMSPPPESKRPVNMDLMSESQYNRLMHTAENISQAVMSSVMELNHIFIPEDKIDQYGTHSSVYFFPIYENLSKSSIVGHLQVVRNWEVFLSYLLPEGPEGVHFVLQSSCKDLLTFRSSNHGVHYLGEGDLHEGLHSDTMQTVYLQDSMDLDRSLEVDEPYTCNYVLQLYASQDLVDEYRNRIPLIISALIAVGFISVTFAFSFQSKLITQRSVDLAEKFARSNELLSSLFPSTVRDRLFGNQDLDNSTHSVSSSIRKSLGFRLKGYLKDGDDFDDDVGSKPIADLFPDCTVLFADIVGFTAWSSVREPTQVFTLLETIYHAFDEIANNLGVFKVETVGDCYVAASGLPEPREDHAVVMTRFAFECLTKVHELTKELEVTLGPDTGDLSMRFGLHSGPVTAGVLRGERSRFQLFGDTVNTASRIESTGRRGRIHLSQETANLLTEAGKGHWLRQRVEKVKAKGKGEMTTYWLIQGRLTDASSVSLSGESHSNLHASKSIYQSSVTGADSSKTARLVDWNVEMLQRLLKEIEARRQSTQIEFERKEKLRSLMAVSDPSSAPIGGGVIMEESIVHKGEEVELQGQVLDEVKEIITLPEFDKRVARHENPESIELDPAIVEQLHDYVTTIASLYNDNPFHNFEHASHVTMSVVKLLTRIIAPSEIDVEISTDIHNERKMEKMIAAKMHDHTYGITSDPLTQFAVVFSALIHDVDHTGVPNTQLGVENPTLAEKYRNESVAEQHSVALSWELMMQPCYVDLRKAIYKNQSEKNRFLQLVVNSVMATDIVNKELKTLRNQRWEKAFSGNPSQDTSADINRKATIVIEHLIQASDVAHTMQHWHIYRKWNERLFREMYNAFKAGRAGKDPSDFWYKGEIGFFDFYIIPLAKKLKDCGVFGVSSDEYLNYATQNRAEWEAKGEEVVADMIENIRHEEDEVGSDESSSDGGSIISM